jgi:hypothetical protein
MAPVAKRNFCRRHDHGMSRPNAGGASKDSDRHDDNGDDDDDDDDDDNEMDESERTVEVADESNPKDIGGDKRKRRRPDDADGSGTSALDIGEGGLRRKGNGNSVSPKRRALWSNLLATRPRTKDPRNLSSWLNEVLTVSDLDFPVDANAPSGIPSETDSEPTYPKILEMGNDDGNQKSIATVQRVASGKRDTTNAGSTNQRSKATKKGGGKGIREAIKSSQGDSKTVPPPPQDWHRESSGEDNTNPNRIPREHDGFAGTFADWRGRKKATKKVSSSLRK